MAKRPQARIGRPPSSSAVETRLRIISVAAELFARQGYGIVTNKDVAAAAGISTGALYYYFSSKLEMYLAVYWTLQTRVDEAIAEAMGSQKTFDGRFRAILEVAHSLNAQEPHIAQFLGTARVDRIRHPELQDAIPSPPGEGARIMDELIEGAVETGEVIPKRRKQVEAVLQTIFVGLVDSQSDDLGRHRQAVDGLLALLDHKLLLPAKREAK